MMRSKWILSIIVVTCGLLPATPAHAVNWKKILCLEWCMPQCAEPKCCDDYCPKPLPCVPPVRCFECDDYCPKYLPCVQKICSFTCDDYCYKCPPVLRCPPCYDLKCVPTSAGCAACGQR